MSSWKMPPHTLANLDQARAELADLVRLARTHRDAGTCGVPVEVGCPGVEAFFGIIRSARPDTLLFLAVGELARTGYGPGGESAVGVRDAPADGEAPTSASPAGASGTADSGARPPVTPEPEAGS